MLFTSLLVVGNEENQIRLGQTVSAKELASRLHRDSSIISRLYSAADRDRNKEKLLVEQLRQ
jgi:hypothetical protein